MTDPRARATRRVGLFLGVEPRAGGMFQYAQSVLEALSRLGNQTAVTIAYGDEAWAGVLARFGLTGTQLKHVRTGQRLADLAMALRLPAALARLAALACNPLVHELRALGCEIWIFPAQESLSYQVPMRAIGTIHDLMHRYEPSFPEVSANGRHAIREHRFGNIARRCVAVLVDSEVGRQQVVESFGVPASRIDPLPYVAPSYLLDSVEREDFEAVYRLPQKFLFYPAQFWPHKNHLRLLDAVQRLAPRLPDLALALSGGKQHGYEDLQRRVVELGLGERVRFVGYVPDADLRGFYRRARALVMPTFFGPTNIPPLEAMATGCPALVSDIYGMREQSGDAAMYFDPRSVDQMAECIERVWRDDAFAAELSRKGLKRSRRYGQAHFNQRLAAILDTVCDAKAGGSVA